LQQEDCRHDFHGASLLIREGMNLSANSSDGSVAVVCRGGECQLFGAFGIAVQCGIGLWCFLVLLAMWRLESESQRRSCAQWSADMSKQGFSTGWMHFMNVFCSIIFGALDAASALTNQCVWYLLIFLTDVIFVTLICWAVTSALREPLIKHCNIDIGEYDDDGSQKKMTHERSSRGSVSWQNWLKQLAIWIAIVTVVKLIVFVGVFLTQSSLYDLIADVFRFIGLCGHPHWQLMFSVIIIPLIGDAFQLAVQDCFLKRRLKDDPADDGSDSEDAEEDD
jgi:hypothetical protein